MRTSPALHFTHDASQHSSFIKAPVLTRHKTVTHSDRPVCSYVPQYFSQRLPFCGKKPPNSTGILQSSFQPLRWSENPSSHWSNCNLPVQTQLHQWAFIAPHPPWIQRYAQLLLCCPETECHFRNTPHSTNGIVLQEALQTAKASKFDFPVSVWALYAAPMHQFSEFTCHRMKRIT